MKILEKQKHKRLGFTKLETAEIALIANKLIASEVIFYHKLRAFHWNVQGRDFFELHELFEQQYNSVKINIDDVAERLRVFGIRPVSSLQEMIAISEIVEVDTDLDGEAMMREVVSDMEVIISLQLELAEKSTEHGDIATAMLATEALQKIEKSHWMFTSWLDVYPSKKSSKK